MGIKTEFKLTEIGVFPNDWSVEKIGSFTEASAGGTPSTLRNEYWNGNIKWMNSGELHHKRVYYVENNITELGLKNSSTKLIPENCVLVGLAGQGKTRGTVAINYIPLCTNQSIAAIYPNNYVNSEYLFYNLDFRYHELRSLSTGDGGRGGLNIYIIKNLFIPLPPTKAEQTAIANALNDMDALIGSMEKLIEKKKAIKQGAMQELLRPKDKWMTTKLEDISINVSSGKSSTNSNDTLFPIYGSTGIIGHRNKNDYEGIKILVARVGANAGTVNIVKGKYCVSDNTLMITLRENIVVEYIYYYLIQLKLNRLVFGSGQPLLTGGQLKKLEINLPGTYEGQNQVVTILMELDSEIFIYEQTLSKYKLLKQGMMQQLLTGKIRLV